MLAIEHYYAQKRNYQELRSYLIERFDEATKLVEALAGFNLDNSNNDEMFGKPIDVFTDYATITNEAAKTTKHNCFTAYNKLITTINETDEVIKKYSKLITEENERARAQEP
ncbi:MAG: hypothetical protein FWH40_07590 [Coriobacteriia bacterium]|nr:hypothetical protein [Coriobacteriia bacterium]